MGSLSLSPHRLQLPFVGLSLQAAALWQALGGAL